MSVEKKLPSDQDNEVKHSKLVTLEATGFDVNNQLHLNKWEKEIQFQLEKLSSEQVTNRLKLAKTVREREEKYLAIASIPIPLTNGLKLYANKLQTETEEREAKNNNIIITENEIQDHLNSYDVSVEEILRNAKKIGTEAATLIFKDEKDLLAFKVKILAHGLIGTLGEETGGSLYLDHIKPVFEDMCGEDISRLENIVKIIFDIYQKPEGSDIIDFWVQDVATKSAQTIKNIIRSSVTQLVNQLSDKLITRIETVTLNSKIPTYQESDELKNNGIATSIDREFTELPSAITILTFIAYGGLDGFAKFKSRFPKEDNQELKEILTLAHQLALTCDNSHKALVDNMFTDTQISILEKLDIKEITREVIEEKLELLKSKEAKEINSSSTLADISDSEEKSSSTISSDGKDGSRSDRLTPRGTWGEEIKEKTPRIRG